MQTAEPGTDVPEDAAHVVPETVPATAHSQPAQARRDHGQQLHWHVRRSGARFATRVAVARPRLTGAEQIFHEMMLRHNVKHVFGYPGGAILPVFDAIHNSPHFEFILPRHEQGAGHMAEGYARVSGKPGVVLVTSGPGATNTITPMQDALSDGTPMIVFTGQVAQSVIGSDAFQEADVIGISRSCTKWNTMVKDIAELPRRINEAFKIATSGRPGPVLVDLPKDVTAAILRTPIPLRYTQPELIEHTLPSNPLSRSHAARRAEPLGVPVRASEPEPTKHAPPDLPLLEKAARLISTAKRPIIYAGHGMLSSPEGPQLLKDLVEKINAPVTTTLLGMGAFDEEDPRSLHMLGMHGSAYANLAMQEADLIIALGARFDDRVTGKVDSAFLPPDDALDSPLTRRSVCAASPGGCPARNGRHHPFRDPAEEHQQGRPSVVPDRRRRDAQPVPPPADAPVRRAGADGLVRPARAVEGAVPVHL